MESKLLIGGRNIMDHTNEQQKMLELKRQEIAEQVGLGASGPLGGCMALRSGRGAEGSESSYEGAWNYRAENLTLCIPWVHPPRCWLSQDVTLYRAPGPNSQTFHKGVSSSPTVGLFLKASRTTVCWSYPSAVILQRRG